MVETLPGWLEGEIEARPQDGSLATYCRTLTKEDGRLDWTRPADALDRQVRACDPWPGAHTTWAGQRLKVLRARARPEWQVEGVPGQVVALEARTLTRTEVSGSAAARPAAAAILVATACRLTQGRWRVFERREPVTW